MKKNKFAAIAAMCTLFFVVMQGCSFSTANMSAFSTSKDKDGKEASSAFKTGETIYAKAMVSNNPGTVKVKLYLKSEKGDTIKGSEVELDVKGDASASYNLPVAPVLTSGKYVLHADMINEAGEKKDSKTAAITVTQDAPKPEPADADKPAEKKDGDAASDDADSE